MGIVSVSKFFWVCWKIFECGGYECECVKLSVQCECEQCRIWGVPDKIQLYMFHYTTLQQQRQTLILCLCFRVNQYICNGLALRGIICECISRCDGKLTSSNSAWSLPPFVIIVIRYVVDDGSTGITVIQSPEFGCFGPWKFDEDICRKLPQLDNCSLCYWWFIFVENYFHNLSTGTVGYVEVCFHILCHQWHWLEHFWLSSTPLSMDDHLHHTILNLFLTRDQHFFSLCWHFYLIFQSKL